MSNPTINFVFVGRVLGVGKEPTSTDSLFTDPGCRVEAYTLGKAPYQDTVHIGWIALVGHGSALKCITITRIKAVVGTFERIIDDGGASEVDERTTRSTVKTPFRRRAYFRSENPLPNWNMGEWSALTPYISPIVAAHLNGFISGALGPDPHADSTPSALMQPTSWLLGSYCRSTLTLGDNEVDVTVRNTKISEIFSWPPITEVGAGYDMNALLHGLTSSFTPRSDVPSENERRAAVAGLFKRKNLIRDPEIQVQQKLEFPPPGEEDPESTRTMAMPGQAPEDPTIRQEE